MPHDTDERLKSYLDTNQLHREQMCRAVLAIDGRFSEVRPRHPRGGPDGGRDVEAMYEQKHRAFAAVGFLNQANDSDEQRNRISKKFRDDTQAALRETPSPEAFFFLTNINLTISEKDKLVSDAKSAGFVHCEILDRERLRISLDSPDGFSIRFQYLGLALSEAEQATFFARWGDDIQPVISTGFHRLEETMRRVLFLQEAQRTLSSLVFMFELKREFAADEIGHFRAFCYMHLKGPTHRIFGICFGSSDKMHRMMTDSEDRFENDRPGIKHGIGGGQWEEYAKDDVPINIFSDDENMTEFEQVGSSSSIGLEAVRFLTIRYEHDHFIRQEPRLKLVDIDESSFIFMLNKSLAEKVLRIHVYSSGYKLQEISRAEFKIDDGESESVTPVTFSAEELSDSWVLLRPLKSTMFSLSFFDQTPSRVFASGQTPDSLAKSK